MKFKKVYFLKSCTSPSSFPAYPYPEFAFFGRSNVGKSSLINMLTGQKNLVKTGSRPGLTQLINFFVADDRISIVDLPGFGFAKAPSSVRKGFIPMIKSYIEERDNLRLAFLLIDVRRIPGDLEVEFISALTGKEKACAIVLTKCDKISKGELASSAVKISKALGVGSDSIFYSSSQKGTGKKELLDLIAEFSGLRSES